MVMPFISALEMGAGEAFFTLLLEAFCVALLMGSNMFLLRVCAFLPPAANVRISDLLKATGAAGCCFFLDEALFDDFLVVAITIHTFLPGDRHLQILLRYDCRF